MFGGLLEKRKKSQLADINLAVTVRLPRLLRESTRLVQYWRCDKESANPPNIIPRQYFRLYGSNCSAAWVLQLWGICWKYSDLWNVCNIQDTLIQTCCIATSNKIICTYIHTCMYECLYMVHSIDWRLSRLDPS